MRFYPTRFHPKLLSVLALACLAGLFGCASVVQKASDSFATNLGNAVLDSNDPATVRDGLPAYLLLLDSLIEGQKPHDKGGASTLLAAAKLYGAYSGNFTGDDKPRAQRLSQKAFDYAKRAMCLQDRALCAVADKDVESFTRVVQADKDTELMYGLASAWAGYLQSHSDDWGAVADLPKVEILLNRVVALDPRHDHGQAYMYLGVLNSIRPESVGGKPELGRSYFEKSVELSGGRNLYAKTLEAEFYARLVFNKDLHDQLLNDVLAADPNAAGFTLINTLAQERAKKLLASGKDYF
jgi:hypothetical protein